MPIKMAFEVAANQMLLQRLPYHDSPMLKVREAMNDSVPFLNAPDADISNAVEIAFAEREIVDRAIAPLLAQIKSVEYELNNGMEKGRGDKRKKKYKNKKTSIQNEIAELQRDVSKLKGDLEQLATIIVKKPS